VLAEAGKRLEQELLVRHRVPDLQRRMPSGQHRQVVVVELVHGLRIVDVQLVVGYLVDPRPHDLAEQLPARLTADALGNYPNRFLCLDEAEWHAGPLSSGLHGRLVGR
jgi:hypothetical protein